MRWASEAESEGHARDPVSPVRRAPKTTPKHRAIQERDITAPQRDKLRQKSHRSPFQFFTCLEKSFFFQNFFSSSSRPFTLY